MVTFITVLQVNLVMSALLYLMFLAYLLGFQARPSDRRPPAQDPVGALIIQLLQEGLSRERQRGGGAEPPGREAGPPEGEAPGPPEHEAWEDYPDGPAAAAAAAAAAAGPLLLLRRAVPDAGADLLRQSKRYSSPRVLLSDRPPLEPPPLYLRDEHAGGGGGGGGANGTRRRRHAQHRSYRGEYSVCDSESQWVTDRTAAVDIRGRPVTVLGSIKAGGLEVKQYFYETNCRSARPARSGCRGIDDKHWSSQCKTAQTYVRALTAERNSVGWRWIRIDTSCVCALSRKKRRA